MNTDICGLSKVTVVPSSRGNKGVRLYSDDGSYDQFKETGGTLDPVEFLVPNMPNPATRKNLYHTSETSSNGSVYDTKSFRLGFGDDKKIYLSPLYGSIDEEIKIKNGAGLALFNGELYHADYLRYNRQLGSSTSDIIQVPWLNLNEGGHIYECGTRDLIAKELKITRLALKSSVDLIIKATTGSVMGQSYMEIPKTIDGKELKAERILRFDIKTLNTATAASIWGMCVGIENLNNGYLRLLVNYEKPSAAKEIVSITGTIVYL